MTIVVVANYNILKYIKTIRNNQVVCQKYIKALHPISPERFWSSNCQVNIIMN